jgi:hypothetical protein
MVPTTLATSKTLLAITITASTTLTTATSSTSGNYHKKQGEEKARRSGLVGLAAITY